MRVPWGDSDPVGFVDEARKLMNRWARHRQDLEAERKALCAALARGTGQINDQASRGSFSQTEEASMAFSERERDFARRSTLSQRLSDIEAALERLRQGTYGVCDGCGSAIPIERLDAMPQATSCLNCKVGTRMSGSLSERGKSG